MSEFGLYFRLGFEHISDLSGTDHILFVIALAAVYSLREWKHMLVLVTAFTIGHSVTLALATLGWMNVDADLIETLIPITILITALINIVERFSKDPLGAEKRDWRMKYVLALAFGLIHGLGFSSYLRAILGTEQNLVTPLFSFNVGLELGQLVILVITLSVSAGIVFLINVVLKRLKRKTDNTQRNWATLLSVWIAVLALTMILPMIWS
ncbi:MAG: HupE/UreJ family protein [Rhodothermales bacterium]|nr:HupE/UreJ family protein [Rhodothermales bacterium]MDG2015573.1 HupE/UreJ family protein [Rhodothermales bacterium]